MKKQFLFLVIFLFTMFSNAQIQDLAQISNGNLIKFNIINKVPLNSMQINTNSIWGYYAIYNLEKIDKNSIKRRVIIFDKNLNKLFEDDYQEYSFGKYQDVENNISFDEAKNKLLLNSYNFIHYTYREVDLENSKISDFYLLNYNARPSIKIFDSYKDYRKIVMKILKKRWYGEKNKSIIIRGWDEIEDNIFNIREYEKIKKKEVLKKIIFHNKDSVKISEYNVNLEPLNKKTESSTSLNRIYNNKNYAYYFNIVNPKKIKSDYYTNVKKIICVDINTGKEIYNNEISEEKLVYSKYNTQKVINENKLIYMDYKYTKDGNNEYTKYHIDLKTGKIINNNTFKIKDLNSYFKIKSGDRLKNNYFLRQKDLTIYNDGSVSFLYEKMKYFGNGGAKTDDLVLVYLDADFKIKEVKTIDKDYSKNQGSDYLFSQYLNEGKNSVHFYADQKRDDKNWYLGIINLKDGKINSEEIQISSKKDKYTIVPYPAKEGYILLREYNEKEKYNQIRLEKLNY